MLVFAVISAVVVACRYFLVHRDLNLDLNSVPPAPNLYPYPYFYTFTDTLALNNAPAYSDSMACGGGLAPRSVLAKSACGTSHPDACTGSPGSRRYPRQSGANELCATR